MSLKLLLVEDDDNFASLTIIRLRAWREDLAIDRARSIGEAQTLLSSTIYQLILLDQHLPDGEGTDVLNHPSASYAAVVAMSSDNTAEIPGRTVKAGAAHFLSKTQIREPLFLPLLEAILARKEGEDLLRKAELRAERMETITTLLATLRHEINNPLGAVLGAAYLLRSAGTLAPHQQDALKMIESSSERIGHVVRELCKAADPDELEVVTKASEKVFQVPGDPRWGSDPEKK